MYVYVQCLSISVDHRKVCATAALKSSYPNRISDYQNICYVSVMVTPPAYVSSLVTVVFIMLQFFFYLLFLNVLFSVYKNAPPHATL